jgi:hypothetical protein
MTFRELPLGEYFYFAKDTGKTICQKLHGGWLVGDYRIAGIHAPRQGWQVDTDDLEVAVFNYQDMWSDPKPPHLRGREEA